MAFMPIIMPMYMGGGGGGPLWVMYVQVATYVIALLAIAYITFDLPINAWLKHKMKLHTDRKKVRELKAFNKSKKGKLQQNNLRELCGLPPKGDK